jgi:hypothetical protein
MKRTFLIGAMLVALPLVAQARDGELVATVFATADQQEDVKTFALRKGQDYVLFASGNGRVALHNPQGQATLAFTPPPDKEQEFRAAYSATYTLTADFQAPGTDAYGALFTDCRGDVKTACTLGFAHGEQGDVILPADRDWYRINLTKGGTYAFELLFDDAPSALLTLTLRDKSGRLLTRRTSATPAAVTMKAPYTGLFFAAVSSAGPSLPGYTLSVRRAR